MTLDHMIARITDWRDACCLVYNCCETRQEERYRLERDRADQIHICLLNMKDLGAQL